MPPNEQYNMNARMLRIDTASFPNGTFHDNNTTDDPTASPSLIPPIPEIDKTGAVVMLIGLVWLMFGILSWPCIRPSLQILQIRFFGKRKTAKRYRTVDSWLITKEVVEHSSSGGQCNCPEETLRQEPANEEDNVDRECIICMEEFALGSAVSWSSREEGCTHVYHKECIREWIGCPYCRQNMLPIDYSAGLEIKDWEMIRSLAAQRTKRYHATHYCQSHGLVVRDDNTNDISKAVSSWTNTKNDDCDEELGNEVDDKEIFVEPPLLKDDDRHEEEETMVEPPVSHSGDANEGHFEIDVEAPAQGGRQQQG